jgi:predicted nuclease with TOPRIM domain
MESMRSKLDCLDAANNKKLEELERHMEDYASENEQLRMQCDKFESEAKASQQNESKYLEEISRLEYRFLKERGKYVAEKNNTQKLARELEVMDQKLRNIIDMKSQEIVHMTEDSACCD